MADPVRWLMHMSRWARKPPSQRKVLLVIGVIVLCLALYGLEKAGAWPDWAQAERLRR